MKKEIKDLQEIYFMNKPKGIEDIIREYILGNTKQEYGYIPEPLISEVAKAIEKHYKENKPDYECEEVVDYLKTEVTHDAGGKQFNKDIGIIALHNKRILNCNIGKKVNIQIREVKE